MKKVNKRLTGTHFLDIYRQVMAPGATVHLKTDSPFLYAYTSAMLSHNSITPLHSTDDLYNSPLQRTCAPDPHLLRAAVVWPRHPQQIHRPPLPAAGVSLSEPEVDIEPDTYRSFGRGTLQGF